MKRREALRKMTLAGSAAVMAPAALSLLQSCQSVSRVTWEPEFFTQEEALFVQQFVDLLLPTTDTPGAVDVKVDIFIDKLAAHIYDEEGQKSLRENIAQFNADCKESFGDVFTRLDRDTQGKVFEQAEKEGGKFNSGVWGTAVGDQEPISFYRNLKSTAIGAYFSSQEIGQNVLNYDPIPAGYNGCIPLSDVGKRWSLG